MTKNTWMITSAVLLWSILCLSAQSIVTEKSKPAQVASFNLTFDGVDSPSTLPSFSAASTFEHYRQLANWHPTDLILELWNNEATDHYLATEPIQRAWYLHTYTSSFRLSGWKDGNLLFRIINYFL